MCLKEIPENLDLTNKKVLLRIDANVPLGSHGIVRDNEKIKAIIPTIQSLALRNAKLIILTHLGRPNGKTIKALRVKPIAQNLNMLLGQTVTYIPDWNFKKIAKAIEKQKPGEIILLENIRFLPGEEKNNKTLSKQLASLGDIFVNDAFAVSHRAHASTVGITKFLPTYAGPLLQKEIAMLSKLIKNPEKPFIALLGGAKITDKITLINTLTKHATKILMGGALANHFFKALGYDIGASVIEPKGVALAKKLLSNKKIILPKDIVVGIARKPRQRPIVVAVTKNKTLCRAPFQILDIGPQTILAYAKCLKTAETLVWNGPVGLFEIAPYRHGTLALGRMFAARSQGFAFGVAGGGETLSALNQTGMKQFIDWISTAGGAMLAFLAEEKMPGLTPLMIK